MTSRELVLCDLAAIFTAATERPATISVLSEAYENSGEPTGRFFKFLCAAVAPVPGLMELTDVALASAAKRATKGKKALIGR